MDCVIGDIGLEYSARLSLRGRNQRMGFGKRDFLAIYIDLENVQKNMDISKLMRDLVVLYETEGTSQEPVYAVKIACGNSSSITKMRDQLKELNFEIRETPHVANKKNRSDLIISLDAFEKLYLDRPSIDEYVFVTNDSDFTVIMDILRRYGRRVVLVTSEEDSKKKLFNNCSDEILLIEDYLLGEGGKKPRGRPAPVKTAEPKVDDLYKGSEPDDTVIHMLVSILRLMDPDREYQSSQLGSKLKELDKSFDLRRTSFKKINRLVEYFAEKKILAVRKDERGNLRVSQINLDRLDAY